MQSLDRLPRESAREYALRFLKHNIINMHLKPGVMISAAELAEVTGISRTPIREAMQELAKTGILEIFPQAGSRIRYIDYGVIHESSFIRLTLELAVVEQACGALRPRDALAFEDILDLQEKCVARGHTDEFLALDHQFHRQIFLMTDKAMTYQVLEGCLWHFDRLRTISFTAVAVERFVQDHREIYEMIRSGDKRGAKRLVTQHLTRYREDEKVIRAKYPEYFAP
ncbi:MAG: GntR family transcriptional regulator [Planctomycetes bacterium]|nr:GntR family transcriptional regulator [Planctomycetota bacterium]